MKKRKNCYLTKILDADINGNRNLFYGENDSFRYHLKINL